MNVNIIILVWTGDGWLLFINKTAKQTISIYNGKIIKISIKKWNLLFERITLHMPHFILFIRYPQIASNKQTHQTCVLRWLEYVYDDNAD